MGISKPMEELPEPGEIWQHRNGILYEVLHLANTDDTDQYPLTIVYRGLNLKVWTRRANDWHRSFKRGRGGENERPEFVE